MAKRARCLSGRLATPGLHQEVRDHVTIGVIDVASERGAQRLQVICVREPGFNESALEVPQEVIEDRPGGVPQLIRIGDKPRLYFDHARFAQQPRESPAGEQIDAVRFA